MAIIAHGEMLIAEWSNEDDVDLLGISVSQEINEPATKIIIQFTSTWEDDRS